MHEYNICVYLFYNHIYYIVTDHLVLILQKPWVRHPGHSSKIFSIQN